MADNLWHKWPVVLNPERIDSFMKLLLGDKYRPEIPVVVYYRDENCRSYGLVVGKENDTLEDFPDTLETVTCIIGFERAFQLLGWDNVGVYCPDNVQSNKIYLHNGKVTQWNEKDQFYRGLEPNHALFNLSNFDDQILVVGRLLDRTPWDILLNFKRYDCNHGVQYVSQTHGQYRTVVTVWHDEELEKAVIASIKSEPERAPVASLSKVFHVPEKVFNALNRHKEVDALSLWLTELEEQQLVDIARDIMCNDFDKGVPRLLREIFIQTVHLDDSCGCPYYYVGRH